jgi:DNA-binding response OmpR family regulator
MPAAISASAIRSTWWGISGDVREPRDGRADSHGRRARRGGGDRLLRFAISEEVASTAGGLLLPVLVSERRMTEYERSPRVLVVEDDEAIAQVLQRSLRLEGYDVRIAPDGISALEDAHAFLPDLVILDLGLPRLDGIDVAKRLRQHDDVPILVLTARDAVEARVQGLDAGADDYLVKPFERQELLARLRALLRRRPPRGQAVLAVGDLKLNPDTHEVTRASRRIDLTQREFELLEYLMRNERIVISRQRLLDEVWGYDPFSMTNTIEVFVSNLRRKLEADGEPRLLHTIRGAGYVLRV